MANAWPTSGYCYDSARTLAKVVLILEGRITGTIFCMKNAIWLMSQEHIVFLFYHQIINLEE
jgi:hypothetical protein